MNKWSGQAVDGELPAPALRNVVTTWTGDDGELHSEAYTIHIPRGEMPKVSEMHLLGADGVTHTVRFDGDA